MKVKCPHCNQNYELDGEFFNFTCQNCGTDITQYNVVYVKNKLASGYGNINFRRATSCRKYGANATHKERLIYILLALFLGGLGIHNFYAGRTNAGFVQILLTIFFGWLIVPLVVVWIWVIIEICTVTCDADGVPFK